jgi:hypothetical protein
MWYFRIANPVVRKGEKGGFKWVFRRFWLDISTVSGNFSARFMADEHPFGYLMAGKTDDNIVGFCQTVYYLGKTLTTDQGLVDDIGKAIAKYEKRLEKAGAAASEKEDEDIAMKEVQAVQEIVEMPRKERRKYERGVDGRFKKAVKDL